MQPSDLFRHCPRCGVPRASLGVNPFQCSACAFTFYFNPTVAAAAFIHDDHGRYVFVRREKDPGRGLLTVPGGFIDIGETAEEALAREVREEVGLAITDVRYVCSLTNRYLYREVTYPVVDLMFHAQATNPTAAIVGDDVTHVLWHRLDEIAPDQLAFPSVKHGLSLLLASRVQG